MERSRIGLALVTLSVASSLPSAQSRLRCGMPERAAQPVGELLPPLDCGYYSTTIQSQYEPHFLINIPVVFHVNQHTNGDGFLDVQTIQDQIDVLNEDFLAKPGSPGAPGRTALIRFHLAKLDPAGNPTTGITYSTNDTWHGDSGVYWNTLAWDTHRYMSVYSNSGAGYFGYVPDWPQGGLVRAMRDRIVV